MALLKSNKVPMPDSKITFKKGKGDAVYVYYTLRSYRREKDNKPTSDEVAIGRKDLETGMLIPNNTYFKIFNVSNSFQINSVKTIGAFYFLDSITHNIHLYEDLFEVFKDRCNQILTVAYYMLTESNTMKYINYFCDENYTYLKDSLSSQRVSELFESITFDDRMNFFKKWSKRIIENEYIAYDVTSISSYSKNIDYVSYGYNRDGENLPQVNLGMYTGEKTKLPVFYNVYNGSITDKEQLVFMMKYTQELQLNNIKFVMDKGFYKKENLNYMYENNYKFVICLSNSYKYVKEYIEKVEKVIQTPSNWNNKYKLFTMCLQYKQDEKVCNIHILYNPDKQVDEQKQLYSTIERAEHELKSFKEIPEKLDKYEKYFDINIKDNKIEYKINDQKVINLLKTTGYIVFLTSDLNLTSIDVLEIYRSKDVIEKNFDSLKNELDFYRLKTHINETTDGKIFVSFIALILKSYIERNLSTLRSELKNNTITVKEILLELQKIKMTKLNDKATTLMALTNTQKKIFKVCEVDENINKILEQI